MGRRNHGVAPRAVVAAANATADPESQECACPAIAGRGRVGGTSKFSLSKISTENIRHGYPGHTAYHYLSAYLPRLSCSASRRVGAPCCLFLWCKCGMCSFDYFLCNFDTGVTMTRDSLVLSCFQSQSVTKQHLARASMDIRWQGRSHCPSEAH